MSSVYRKKKYFSKPHPQSFIIFVYEFQRNEAKLKNKIVSLKEAYAGGAVAWKELSVGEKDRYERVASSPTWKEYKSKYQSYSYSMTFSELENIEIRRANEENLMFKDIDLIVEKAISNETIAELNLYFIMANYFVKLNDLEETYIPAEISISRFSLREGIINKFHTFVNPGVLPFGYALQAKEHAKTHQLELPPNAVGEENLGRVYTEIVKFISSHNKDEKIYSNDVTLPPVYTNEENVRIIKSILKFCKNDCFEDNVPDIRVYPLQNIFYKMKSAACRFNGIRPPKSIIQSNELLLNDNYEYEMRLSCKFHENLDCAKFCPLSSVTRWCYIFAENICPDLDIKLSQGYHLPSQENYDAGNCKAIEVKPMPICEPKYNSRRSDRKNFLPDSLENTVKDEYKKLKEKKIKVEKLEFEDKGDSCKYEYDSDIQSIKSLNKSVVSIDSDSDPETANLDKRNFEKLEENERKRKDRVDPEEKKYKKEKGDSWSKKKRFRKSRSNSYLDVDDDKYRLKQLSKYRKDIDKRKRSKSTDLKSKLYRRSNSRDSSRKPYEKYYKHNKYSRSRSKSKCKSKSRSQSREFRSRLQNKVYFNRERTIKHGNYDICSRSRSKSKYKSRSRSPSRTFKTRFQDRNYFNRETVIKYEKSRSRSPSRIFKSRLRDEDNFNRENVIKYEKYNTNTRSRSRSGSPSREFENRFQYEPYFEREREIPLTSRYTYYNKDVYRNLETNPRTYVAPRTYAAPHYYIHSYNASSDPYSKSIYRYRKNY